MSQTHPMTTRSQSNYDHVERGAADPDSQWWQGVRWGMKKHIEARQASDRWVTAWGLLGVGLLVWWMGVALGSSFWKLVFCGIIISDCLFSDGCLFGRKTKMPDWVNAENLQAGGKRKRRVPRRVWRNMYSESSDEN